MNTLVNAVFGTSDGLKDNRTLHSILSSALAELGELAEEVNIHEGKSYKQRGSDGILGESIDVICAVLDLVRQVHPRITEREMVDIARTKLDRWVTKVVDSKLGVYITEPAFSSKEMIFLSAPYTSDDPDVVQYRIDAMLKVDAYMMARGIHTVSPLYKHMSVAGGLSVPGTWDYWRDYSLNLITRCDRTVVVMLDGWMSSTGVMEEIDTTVKQGKFVSYINEQRLQEILAS